MIYALQFKDTNQTILSRERIYPNDTSLLQIAKTIYAETDYKTDTGNAVLLATDFVAIRNYGIRAVEVSIPLVTFTVEELKGE